MISLRTVRNYGWGFLGAYNTPRHAVLSETGPEVLAGREPSCSECAGDASLGDGRDRGAKSEGRDCIVVT